jgi:F420H(2)-dependent quinone reductase
MALTGQYAPSSRPASRQQAETYEASGGTQAADLMGTPIVVLTSVGAKTGLLRKNPLIRIEHDGQYAVLASNGGSPRHPVWYYNVATDPHVELQDGATKKDYLAHLATGEERALWWNRAVAVWPQFHDYTVGLGRTIPLLVLVPIEAASWQASAARPPIPKESNRT